MVMMGDPGRIDDAGDVLSWSGSATKRGHGCSRKDFNTITWVFSACAGAALYRRSVLAETGLFDEKFESYLEDIDLGLRLNLAGYRCMYVPDAVIQHKGHGSRINQKKYIVHMTRNRLMVFLKNIPLSLFIQHLPLFLAGQAWYAGAYRNFFASAVGYFLFLRMLPSVIHEHRVLRTRRKLSHEQIRSLLTYDKPR
jgi:GT2 family glycosyltransferase